MYNSADLAMAAELAVVQARSEVGKKGAVTAAKNRLGEIRMRGAEVQKKHAKRVVQRIKRGERGERRMKMVGAVAEEAAVEAAVAAVAAAVAAEEAAAAKMAFVHAAAVAM